MYAPRTQSPTQSAIAAGLLALLFLPPAARAQTVLPDGFEDVLLKSGLDLPTAFDFVPGSTSSHWRLLFVEQKTAQMRMLVDGGLGAIDPVITVPNVRTSGSEQGLLGVALDPGFPARPYVYVHADDDRSANIRISRFTLTGDLFHVTNGQLGADPASRFDLVTNIPDQASNHNGGTVRFGPDGMLYVSLGEDATPCGAQDSVSLRGVILRLRVNTLPAGPGRALRSQIVPADNPYAAHPDSNTRLVWALGLRNPFRFQIDMPTGRLVIGDVGQDTWEEVDLASGGGQNFGWPFFEADMSLSNCAGRSSAGLVGPIAKFDHGDGASVMSAGVYRPVDGQSTSWPAEYDGDVFYSDYYGGMLRRRSFNGSAWVPESAPGQPNANDWATGFDAVTDYRVGPDGGLWYCRQGGSPLDGSGEIRRILFTNNPVDTTPPPAPARLSMRAWPQPAHAQVTVAFTLPSLRRVTLGVYDARGRLVRQLLENGLRPAGETRATWDGHDDRGRVASAGVYWARLVAGADSRSIRIAWVP